MIKKFLYHLFLEFFTHLLNFIKSYKNFINFLHTFIKCLTSKKCVLQGNCDTFIKNRINRTDNPE